MLIQILQTSGYNRKKQPCAVKKVTLVFGIQPYERGILQTVFEQDREDGGCMHAKKDRGGGGEEQGKT